jgi:hypothetical protein
VSGAGPAKEIPCGDYAQSVAILFLLGLQKGAHIGIFTATMKNRIGLVVLVVVCVGLAIAMITVKKQATEQHNTDAVAITTLSNNLTKSEENLQDQKKVAEALEKGASEQKVALTELSNNLAQTSANLASTEEKLTKAEATMKDELAKRDTKIAELETSNQALDQKAVDLSASITNLTLQITDTQKKLVASEGDKDVLARELKRLQAEKAELERQFNDLTVLRAQVAKLKEDLSISRRLEWIRQGLFANQEQKGAQRLMHGSAAVTPTPQVAQAKPATRAAYDLNVEVSADGSVKVIPPLTTPATTNAPPLQ